MVKWSKLSIKSLTIWCWWFISNLTALLILYGNKRLGNPTKLDSCLMNTALQHCFVFRVLEMQACPYVTVGLERVLGSDPGICTSITDPTGLGIRSAVVSCKYWLIWNSPHNKNAEKFCGHGKYGVVVDTYSTPLCLWITSLVMQVFSDRDLGGPGPDSTRTWIFLNTRYPTST